jgi:hypothetical protein
MYFEESVSNRVPCMFGYILNPETNLTGHSGQVNDGSVNRYRGKKEPRQKGTGQNIMKKITSAVLGLSLTLATAGLTFAAQAAPSPAATDKATPAPVAKKHVKKHKKEAAAPATASTTPAPAPAK